EGTGAADKEQVLGLPGYELSGVQAGRPLGPLARGDPPRIGTVFHVLEQVEELLGKTALRLHQIAAQSDDLRHLLDTDRTLGHAGAAGGAGPDRFLAYGCLSF